MFFYFKEKANVTCLSISASLSSCNKRSFVTGSTIFCSDIFQVPRRTPTYAWPKSAGGGGGCNGSANCHTMAQCLFYEAQSTLPKSPPTHFVTPNQRDTVHYYLRYAFDRQVWSHPGYSNRIRGKSVSPPPPPVFQSTPPPPRQFATRDRDLTPHKMS